jgi:hypothetical protein
LLFSPSVPQDLVRLAKSNGFLKELQAIFAIQPVEKGYPSPISANNCFAFMALALAF